MTIGQPTFVDDDDDDKTILTTTVISIIKSVCGNLFLQVFFQHFSHFFQLYTFYCWMEYFSTWKKIDYHQ